MEHHSSISLKHHSSRHQSVGNLQVLLTSIVLVLYWALYSERRKLSLVEQHNGILVGSLLIQCMLVKERLKEPWHIQSLNKITQ